ncbi:MAG: Uma2 family endonuclease [Hormoscilla sp. GUM202]|nr:Uma2 family endonuclease [Hormoscilla sp. GUM202]
MTFEEYRFYQGEPNVLYELFRGHLIPMATPTSLHTRICKFIASILSRHFVSQNLALIAIDLTGVRTETNSSRIPDVVVCSAELWEQSCSRPGAGILDFGEVPTLVVEVTSENWREDYVRKRAEYASVDIPEYWIVDPNKEQVWILSNPGGQRGYDLVEYTRGQSFRSVQFPQLVLSVNTVLAPPVVEDLIREEQAQLRQAEQRADREQQRAEEKQQLAEQERQRAEQERQRADRERQRAEEKQQLAEQERQRAEQERQRADREQQLAEQERQRAEQERQRADRERQRAEQLAAKLKEMGLDLDTI